MADRFGAAAADIGRRTATVEYNRQDPASSGRWRAIGNGATKFDLNGLCFLSSEPAANRMPVLYRKQSTD